MSDVVETIEIELDDSDVIDGDQSLAELIASLQSLLDRVPEEHVQAARIKVFAHDWEGSCVSYIREMTNEEKSARLAVIDRQRDFVGKTVRDDWLRAVRMRYGLGRDEAIEFIKTNADANELHPDLMVQKTVSSVRPWAVTEV